MAALPAIALVATVASGAMAAAGTIAAGRAARDRGQAQAEAANLEAQHLNVRAKEERALAQRDALEARRRKELALSSLQSKAAASGFTATDPSTLAIADEISKYGTLQEQTAQYGGETAAKNTRFAASMRQNEGRYAAWEGESAMKRSQVSAIGSLMGTAGSAFSQYDTMTRRPSTMGRYS